ncbi:MAG: lysostaphin resistance A-like protein, partial [Candidatus Heimdallarchaeota archaeon]
RDIVYGVLLGVVLFFLVNFRMTFTSLPTFDFDVGAAVILFVVSFGVASWQEENIYRGHLQPKLELLATPKWRANAIQAILFSIAHIGFWQFTSIATLLFDLAKVALLGFVLGYYRQRYGSLLAPFIAHGLLDFFPIFWQY